MIFVLEWDSPSAVRRGIFVETETKHIFKLRQERNLPPRRGSGFCGVADYKDFAPDGVAECARFNSNGVVSFSPALADAVGLRWENVKIGKQL